MATEKYIPGVCNIGPAEQKMRRRMGYIALVVTVVLWIILLLEHASAYWFLVLFFPAAGAATGFLQSAMHFCARFGMRGLYNTTADMTAPESVEKAEFRSADQKKAREIIIYSVLIGLLIAVSAALLVA